MNKTMLSPCLYSRMSIFFCDEITSVIISGIFNYHFKIFEPFATWLVNRAKLLYFILSFPVMNMLTVIRLEINMKPEKIRLLGAKKIYVLNYLFFFHRNLQLQIVTFTYLIW